MTNFDESISGKPSHLRGLLSRVALASFGAITLSACQTGGDGQDFISDDPLAGGYGEEGGYETNGTGGDPAGEDGGEDNDGGDGDVQISEADIVQLEGDKLYALSQYAGLTVVDMTNPDDLRALGTWETDAMPFEMYVESGQAFVMFNDYGFWEWDEGLDDWGYYSSSRLVALDAADPADIQVRGEFTLPGSIQDSRRVGDVLYLVTFEDGWCWGCDGTQRTLVTSVDISDEAHPQIVDQLEFLPDGDNWDWQRSVASTTERMYVASRTWEWQGMGSTIDVIDISAGDGTLVPGTQVEVAGRIDSRWQIDEYQGVLRVISQFGWTDDPRIQTFTIESSQSIVALGEGNLDIPMPESLRSVRFDGERAYAITAEQTDPLFTVDLSDPANPVQAGELEIPGWVYHMEVRGDRVLALGFDPAHPDGSINVSLFDVSVFDQPALRRRVHFGGDWADFAEDQNRIHKAFTILEDEQMLLVPFSGWDYEGDNYECYGSYRSGVQIIDWLDDDLDLRGLVATRGRARRAFTHRDRIVTLSDTELASHDYANRDMPAARDQLQVAVNVTSLVHSGDVWVRTARDWSTSQQLLEIVSGDDPGAPEALGRIDLATGDGCSYAWIEQLFAIDDHVFVIQSIDGWSEGGDYLPTVRVLSIDVSDPSNPMIADEYELAGARDWGTDWLGAVQLNSSWTAHHGQHLALLMRNDNDDSEVQVLDLSDPSAIALAATLGRPAGQTQGQLSVLSDTIVSWHTEPVPNQPGKVRFYFDRLVLDEAPNWAAKVNVPGVIVAYDAAAERAFTVDFKTSTSQTDWQSCYENPKYWSFGWESEQLGTCTTIEQPIRELELAGDQASLVRSFDVEGDEGIQQLSASDTRIFAKVGHTSYNLADDSYDYEEVAHLAVLDIDADTPVVHEFDSEAFGNWWRVLAIDAERAIVSGGNGELSLIDTSDVEHIEAQQSSLPGWGSCYNPVIDGDTVYCPMGAYGLETVQW